MSPGPGEYEKKDNNNLKGFNMDKSTRRAELINNAQKSSNLGPGQYQQTYDTFGNNTKKMTIGSKREEKSYNQSPGPGAYDYKNDLTKDKVKSFKQSTTKRQEVVSKEESSKIGPGHYNV